MDRQGIIYQAQPAPQQPGLTKAKKGRPAGAKDRAARLARPNADQRAGMVLTQRDIAILEALYQYRVMTSTQIETLLFPTTTTHAQARLRLRLLFQHGYVYRAEQLHRRSDATKPFLYFLDARGAAELAALYGCIVKDLDWSRTDRAIGPLHVAHLLLTQDIRIAITRSAIAFGCTVAEWRDEKTLRRAHHDDLVTFTRANGETHTTQVIPDGFFRLEWPNPMSPSRKRSIHRCIEIDRATVTGRATSEHNRAWDKKVLAYLAWHKSGMYQARYRTQALGILTITTGEERLSNLKRITEEAGARERFWFTCLSRLAGADILLDALWSVATTTDRRSIMR